MAKVNTDWQAQLDVLSSNRYMLENHVACDVTFYVGKEKKKVTAHKYVLMSRSSVLCTMLCGSHPQETGPINIPDIEPEVFEELLRYIYHEAFEINEKSILPLLYAAKKYAVKSLVNRLKERVCLDNVCIVLQHTHANDDDDLRSKCLEFIIDNGSSVLKHSSFRNLSPECVEMVLKRDELWAKEEEVYEAMKDWARDECAREQIQPSNENMRRVLGGMKNLIRFSVMDEKYFTNKVAADDILTSDEKVQIFRRFRAGCNLDTTKFEHTARVPRFHLMQRVVRSHTHYTGSGFDAIDFRCSESMLLLGTLIYGTSNIEVRVLDESKRTMISLTREIKESTGKLVEILFDNAIFLQRSWYTITHRMSNSPTCQSSQGGQGVGRLRPSHLLLKSDQNVVRFGTGEFIEFRSSSLSNECKSQIPGLLICRRRLK